MGLNSSLYLSKIFHERKYPKINSFWYTIFMFSLDLDELELLHKRFKLFGYNKFNIFSFYDSDHFKKSDKQIKRRTTQEKLTNYLQENGIEKPARVKLITNLRIFGYVFNPVSFYYCYDKNGEIYCSIAEVSNTFGEMKMYLLENIEDGFFKEVKKKMFYISPFTELDDYLDLKVGLPGKKLKIFIDDFADHQIKVRTVLTAKKRKLTDGQLINYLLRFPLLTIQIISLIHWQALKLWLKGVNFIPKNENPHLQKDIYFKPEKNEDKVFLQKNSPEPVGQYEGR